MVTYRDGLPARRQSPIQVLTGLSIVDRDQRVTAKPNRQVVAKKRKLAKKNSHEGNAVLLQTRRRVAISSFITSRASDRHRSRDGDNDSYQRERAGLPV